MNKQQNVWTVILVLSMVVASTYAQTARKYVGWSTGYHTNWDGKSPTQLNYKPYTHMCWFSGSINAPSLSEGKAFTAACHQNNTKAILCLGGAGAGNSFTSNTTNANRGAFISKSVAAMVAQGFDGIDLDWEDVINATQYTALHKELRDSLNKITPRPLLTVATAGYLSSNTATVKDVFDQVNVMSYWSLIGNMQNEMNTFTSKGFAKEKLGVGYGYDNDGEVDINNPNDIGAKCLFAINGGYGGVMVWEVALACTKCADTTAYYVNKDIANSIHPSFAARMAAKPQISFALVNNGENANLRYIVPAAAFVDMKMFNMRGMLVRDLVHGDMQAGTYTIPIVKNNETAPINPGAYIVKMATPQGNQSGTIILK